METTLLDNAEYHASFPSPDTRSDEENEAICAMLEALFNVSKERKPEYPAELSQLLRAVNGERRTIFALNAGDGSIVSAFDAAATFGIEPDEKLARLRKGGYQAVVGDLPRLRELFEPFGVLLEDVVLVLREETDLDEMLAFVQKTTTRAEANTFIVCHGERNAELAKRVPGAYAAVGIAGTDLTIVFAVNAEITKRHYHEFNPHVPARDDAPPLMERTATLDTLDLLAPWVQQQYEYAKHPYARVYRSQNTYDTKRLGDLFTAIRREFGRRHLRETKTYDIELYAGRLINFLPSEWAKRVLEQMSRTDIVGRLNKRDVSFFAQNAGFWDELVILADKGLLLIDPRVVDRVGPIVELAKQATTPLRELKPQERIGYLREVSEIKCIKTDENRGIEEGRWYRIALREREYFEEFKKTESVKGNLEEVRKRRRYLHQVIQIDGRHAFYDDNAEDIRYLLRHFAVPDPGDIATRYPDAVQRMRDTIAAVEGQYLAPRGFHLKPYQAEDLARVLTKDRAILAWEQGLGKSLGGLTFSVAAAVAFAKQKKRESKLELPTLIVAPQDLIPQWIAEAKKFYGIELTWIGRHKGGKSREVGDSSITGGAIRNLIEARALADKLRVDPYAGGFYITHFEALTSGGARNLKKIEEPFTVRIEKRTRTVKAGWRTVDGERTYFPAEVQEYDHEISSAYECPNCGGEMAGRESCPNVISSHGKGYFHKQGDRIPVGYRKCGYTRVVYKLPSIGSVLATAFRKGVIVVDEGTQIASAKNSNERTSSQKTKAVCGMRSAYRLVMSGTPVKNFIAQAFWLLWWGIGNKSERFPYGYSDRGTFAKDFTVLEWTFNEETEGWNNVKEVGEVTNHSRLWSQLAAVLLRRVKEQTGELIPPKKIHVINTPLGYYQREQMEFWLQHFHELYAERHPDDSKVKKGTHVSMAAMLGMDVKLNYAAVLPRADKDWDWTGVQVSNWTPATLKTLETTMSLVKQGRQVLLGTDLRRASWWLAKQLESKGVLVKTMLKQDGSGDTLDPQDRAAVVRDFQDGKCQVLVSTQKAIRLGHNLDAGSAVVLHGLDWDYETYAQFRDRVHRLTSKNPVDVYVVIPGPKNLTLVGRKWDVIQDKAKGAAMAIDGSLPEAAEVPVDIGAIIRELQEKGIEPQGDEMLEGFVKKAWDEIPNLTDFEIPAGFADDQAKPWHIDWLAANAALEQHLDEVSRMDDLHAEALWWDGVRHLIQYDEPIGPGWDGPVVVTEAEWEALAGAIENGEDHPLDPELIGRPVEVSEEPAPEEELIEALAPTPTVVVQAPVLSSSEIKQRLIDLKELHDLGIVDADEFQETKTELLALLRGAAPKAEAAPGEQLSLVA